MSTSTAMLPSVIDQGRITLHSQVGKEQAATLATRLTGMSSAIRRVIDSGALNGKALMSTMDEATVLLDSMRRACSVRAVDGTAGASHTAALNNDTAGAHFVHNRQNGFAPLVASMRPALAMLARAGNDASAAALTGTPPSAEDRAQLGESCREFGALLAALEADL